MPAATSNSPYTLRGPVNAKPRTTADSIPMAWTWLQPPPETVMLCVPGPAPDGMVTEVLKAPEESVVVVPTTAESKNTVSVTPPAQPCPETATLLPAVVAVGASARLNAVGLGG